MVTGPFFSDSSKDRRLQSVGPSSISSCERCSADGISASLFHRRNVAFSLTSEINRVSVVAPGRIIRCCISHPVARSKSRPGRSLLIQLRVYKGHCCKVSDEAAFCLIQRPYISKTLLTRRISPRDHHNKMLRPGLCVVHASPQYL